MYFRIGNGKGQGASFQKLKNFQISLLENFISSKLCILKTFKKTDYKYYFLYYFNKILMLPLVTILLHLNKHMQ